MSEQINFIILPKHNGCTHEEVVTLQDNGNMKDLGMFGGRTERKRLFLRCVDCKILFSFKKEEDMVLTTEEFKEKMELVKKQREACSKKRLI